MRSGAIRAAAIAGLMTTGCSGFGSGGSSLDPATATCAEMPLDAVAGQMVMTRMEAEATPGLLAAARSGAIGGVIVFPPAGVPVAALRPEIERLQQAARARDNPPLLVATDQEGGPVKRFPEGPPTLSPAELGQSGEASAAAREGSATARFLAGAGINMDLAPVVDVALDPASFMASRTFGADAEAVADLGGAFAGGLERGGVAPVLKHFPGLGRATANTDLGASTVSAGHAAMEADLVPFRAGIEAGAPAVMVSLASYPGLGSPRPAAMDRAIVTQLLRQELGFEGVVVTDDLQAPAAAFSRSAAQAAARAGADVLLFARVGDTQAAGPLVQAVRSRALQEASLRASCARILRLKRRFAGWKPGLTGPRARDT
jgi:beta-N-acetylhexosaminidase